VRRRRRRIGRQEQCNAGRRRGPGAGCRPEQRRQDGAATGPADDRGQRRPPAAPPGRRSCEGARARRRALRLRADVSPHASVHPPGGPGAVPRRDAAGPRDSGGIPAVPVTARARARDRGDGLGRVQHRVQPRAGRRTGRRGRHGAGAASRRRPPHRLVPLPPGARPAAHPEAARRARRVPRLHDDHQRAPAAASVVGESRAPGAHRRRRSPCPARRRAGRHRESALGLGVPSRAGPVPAAPRGPGHAISRGHGDRRAARARRPADPPRPRTLGRVRRGQPALEPVARMLSHRDAGRDRGPSARADRRAARAGRARRVHADVGATSRLHRAAGRSSDQNVAGRPRRAAGVLAAHGGGRGTWRLAAIAPRATGPAAPLRPAPPAATAARSVR
jgi:hypothetical protein